MRSSSPGITVYDIAPSSYALLLALYFTGRTCLEPLSVISMMLLVPSMRDSRKNARPVTGYAM